jgi:hypothetical protein
MAVVPLRVDSKGYLDIDEDDHKNAEWLKNLQADALRLNHRVEEAKRAQV